MEYKVGQKFLKTGFISGKPKEIYIVGHADSDIKKMSEHFPFKDTDKSFMMNIKILKSKYQPVEVGVQGEMFVQEDTSIKELWRKKHLMK